MAPVARGLFALRELGESSGSTGILADASCDHAFPVRALPITRCAWSCSLWSISLGTFYVASPGSRSVSHGSLCDLQVGLTKIGGEVVKHARPTCFRIAEVPKPFNALAALPRRVCRLLQYPPVR